MPETAVTDPTLLILALLAAFVAVTALVYTLIQLLGRGVQSYEAKYVTGAHRTLDAMYLAMTPRQILLLSLLSTLTATVLLGATTMNIWVGLVAGLAAFILPSVLIRVLKWRRDKKFGVQLVDGLVAMGNALRAGHSLPAALELIAREMENPMGQEMRLVMQEMRLGVTMEDALANLHRRMPGEDLDILITSVLISRELGGNLAEVFDNIAHTIRERHRIEGKIKALTAQGRLQGAIVSALPILIWAFLNAMQPELMRPMYQHTLGWVLLGLIVVLLSVGIAWIRKIVTIKV
jgi:tight adherence protein B